MMSFSLRLLPLSLLLALLTASAASSVNAIIIRHDRTDASYVVDERDFPQIFSLHYRFNNRVCMASLISPQWALTAGHCTDETPIGETLARGDNYVLSIAGSDYYVSELILHPAYAHPLQSQAVDLALLKLDRTVPGIEPLILYRDQDEAGQVLSFLGWGYTGSGTRGRARNDGKFRRAYNTVFTAGQWLEFHFDDPRVSGSNALPLEGIPGLGDSGGPAILETEEFGPVLVGVALGEIANEEEPFSQGRYGSVSLYERVSTHYDWIHGVLNGD